MSNWYLLWYSLVAILQTQQHHWCLSIEGSHMKCSATNLVLWITIFIVFLAEAKWSPLSSNIKGVQSSFVVALTLLTFFNKKFSTDFYYCRQAPVVHLRHLRSSNQSASCSLIDSATLWWPIAAAAIRRVWPSFAATLTLLPFPNNSFTTDVLLYKGTPSSKNRAIYVSLEENIVYLYI